MGRINKADCKNVYKCVRRPHYLSVRTFVTFPGLLIGYPVTYIIITVTQWLWVFLFVIFIEEKECLEKFGNKYSVYREKVPLFFGNPFELLKRY